MKRTAQYEYWPNKTKKIKKMPAFEIDVFNKIYVITVTCCTCLVYLSDSL